MSLEEWIHDEDCLQQVHDRWDYEKNILENRWGMLAEEDFKGCQGCGCEESPEIENGEACKEDLSEI